MKNRALRLGLCVLITSLFVACGPQKAKVPNRSTHDAAAPEQNKEPANSPNDAAQNSGPTQTSPQPATGVCKDFKPLGTINLSSVLAQKDNLVRSLSANDQQIAQLLSAQLQTLTKSLGSTGSAALALLVPVLLERPEVKQILASKEKILTNLNQVDAVLATSGLCGNSTTQSGATPALESSLKQLLKGLISADTCKTIKPFLDSESAKAASDQSTIVKALTNTDVLLAQKAKEVATAAGISNADALVAVLQNDGNYKTLLQQKDKLQAQLNALSPKLALFGVCQ